MQIADPKSSQAVGFVPRVYTWDEMVSSFLNCWTGSSDEVLNSFDLSFLSELVSGSV
jgi:hypothetical protein